MGNETLCFVLKNRLDALITAFERRVIRPEIANHPLESREAASAHHAGWPMQGCASHLPDTLS